MFGTQDGRDGYDFIEWLAGQHWSNGKVGMFGNSGVGMVQYRIAAEQPPHLICIAPWEGAGSLPGIALRGRHPFAGLQQLYRRLAGRLGVLGRQQRHGR